ncbi:ATP-binding protein [Kitasatospora griseola]
MSKVVRHPRGRRRPHGAPWYTLYPRRLLALWAWFRHWWHGVRTKREARRSIVPNRSWFSPRLSSVLVRSFAVLGAICLVAWVGLLIWTGVVGPVGWFNSIQNSNWFGTIVPFLLTAFGVTVFLLVGYRWTRKPVVVKARKRPQDLVPTAGTIIDEIVGRDELSQVIAQTLRNRRTRRPYVLIGGVGVGKTAVLVELTRMLAEHGAVPVPVRLRDATVDGELDFEALGRSCFLREAGRGVLFSGQLDRTWRQLRLDDKVVVIADGLEEALLDDAHRDDRDNLIRRAIDRANRDGLPLVVASRPHAPLESSPAAIAVLEPLSEEAALDYVLRDAEEVDERRLDWIVETAGVTDSPFYLQIARRLREVGLLEHLALREQPDRLDTRTQDAAALRLGLLDTYRTALEEGRLYGDLVLDRRERQKTIQIMAALACLGLIQDSLEVTFDDLVTAYEETRPDAAKPAEPQSDAVRLTVSVQQRGAIWEALTARFGGQEKWLGDRYSPNELRTELARFARNGQQLGLVTSHENKVRFPHSILQAYLGFHLLSTIDDQNKIQALVEQALQPPGPSRELLIALVLLSRHGQGPTAPGPSEPLRHLAVTDSVDDFPSQERHDSWTLAEVLCAAAKGRHDAKFFDLYAAALEIDSVGPESVQPAIAVSLANRWPEVNQQIKDDQRTVEEAKLGLVRRFGAALREVDQHRGRCTPGATPRRGESAVASKGPVWKSELQGIDRITGTDRLTPAYAYESFALIGRREPSRPVRLATAQEIAAGGDDAYRVLREHFRELRDPVQQYLEKVNKSKRDEDEKFRSTVGDVTGIVGVAESGRPSKEQPPELQEIVDGYLQDRAELWREFVMRAWLVPMFVGSLSETYREEAKDRLDIWLRHLDPAASLGKPLPAAEAPSPDSAASTRSPDPATSAASSIAPLTTPRREPDLPLSLEIALAQGFKYAANRRRRHPNSCDETRPHLVRQAEKMLTCSRYWHAQVSLLHALCLWELPDGTGPAWPRATAGRARHRRGHIATNGTAPAGHGGTDDPVQAVARWLSMAGSAHARSAVASSGGVDSKRPLHPFVAEAGDLVALALEAGRPERFLWIDENGAIDSVGSRPAGPDRYRKHNLWIAPSVGWSILHPRAQQLVADMLIMLNLTERNTASPDDLEERLVRAAPDTLPPCLTHDRTRLHPERSVGRAESDQPGSTCLYECRFRLCPYPPKAGKTQTEIEEPFCRQQQALLHSRSRWPRPAIRRTTPTWVGIPVRALDRFWETMASRNHRSTESDQSVS